MARPFSPSPHPPSAPAATPAPLRAGTALAGLLVVAIGAGCSTRQAYDSAQGWQRNACNRIVDAIERERCVASTTTSYDDYRRQRTAPDASAK